MYNKDIAEATRYYKESPKGVDIMCKAMEDMRNKVRVNDIKRIMDSL